jgi:asparagine synthase (glutamine-hydrolysing)
MCGICGKLNFDGQGIREDLIRKMCRSFSYRGPDDEGTCISPLIGLGHRRLSIIDLSPAGHQPMCNEDETIWIVFNGEIYDFNDIRETLQSKGHTLKSRTDTETIIHLYEEEGVDCLKHLNGMFSFGLWDSRRQRLWLARDRLGIKPLNYYWDGRHLIFASEIKAILCDPSVRREIDPEALDLYLTLNYIPPPWTIFKNIRKLMPGSWLVAEKGMISVESFWDIPKGRDRSNTTPTLEAPTKDITDIKRHLYTLLEDAVIRRLISDVPFGAFLSGGIDSSLIVALMARNSNQPIKTFSIGYKDLPSFDETQYAREVAAFNKTDHQEFKLGHRDILDAFPLVLECVDEPFADSSAVPTYIVSRETRKHVTVALSGDGGDELFAGYRMYQGEHWSRYFSKIPRFVRDGLIAPLINALPDARDKPSLEKIRRAKKLVKGMSLDFPERFCRWREVFPLVLRQDLLTAPPEKDLYLSIVRKIIEKEGDRFSEDMINLMLYMDVRGLLHGDMLTKVDRMSMANSLEVRVPFLDHTVVEYVFQLEGRLKLKGKTGKYILMETFKDLLPPSLHNRPKWGFEMPIGAWLRNELKFLIDEYLTEDVIKKQALFDFGVIKRLIRDHMNERQDTSWHLWNLIVFQHWHKTYL